MPTVILAQVIPPFFNGAIAFGQGEWGSGAAPLFADITLVAYGLLMLGAVAVMQRWPRSGLVAIGVIEIIFLLQTTQLGGGGHAFPTPFMLASASALAVSLALTFATLKRSI